MVHPFQIHLQQNMPKEKSKSCNPLKQNRTLKKPCDVCGGSISKHEDWEKCQYCEEYLCYACAKQNFRDVFDNEELGRLSTKRSAQGEDDYFSDEEDVVRCCINCYNDTLKQDIEHYGEEKSIEIGLVTKEELVELKKWCPKTTNEKQQQNDQ